MAGTMERLAEVELQAGRREEAFEMHENAVRLRKVRCRPRCSTHACRQQWP